MNDDCRIIISSFVNWEGIGSIVGVILRWVRRGVDDSSIVLGWKVINLVGTVCGDGIIGG
jgi:hypothetical protein